MQKTPSGRIDQTGRPEISLGKKWLRLVPSKAACRKAALLEGFARAAWAEIIPAQLFFQKFIAVDVPHASFDVCF